MTELAKKVTRTVTREYDAEGKLTAETVTGLEALDLTEL